MIQRIRYPTQPMKVSTPTLQHSRVSCTYHSMPVELTVSTLLQVLLRSRDVFARRDVRNHLLTDPTSVVDFCFRIRKAPFQVGDQSTIR